MLCLDLLKMEEHKTFKKKGFNIRTNQKKTKTRKSRKQKNNKGNRKRKTKKEEVKRNNKAYKRKREQKKTEENTYHLSKTANSLANVFIIGADDGVNILIGLKDVLFNLKKKSKQEKK